MGGFPSATTYAQPGTSPKQQMIIPQYGGCSPGSNSNSNLKMSSTSINSQGRKSTAPINVGSLKKRTAPAPPPVTTGNSTSIYGTLPHAPRHSQNFDETVKGQLDTYSTLPHSRTNESKNFVHYDNKNYERFEPLMNASQQARYDKHRYDTADSGGAMTTFTGGSQTHKRSPSGDSIGRNLQLGLIYLFFLFFFKVLIIFFFSWSQTCFTSW